MDSSFTQAIPLTVRWTHARSHTHLHSHTDISKEAEWDVSVYLCESRRVINQACVSASNQPHLLIVTYYHWLHNARTHDFHRTVKQISCKLLKCHTKLDAN